MSTSCSLPHRALRFLHPCPATASLSAEQQFSIDRSQLTQTRKDGTAVSPNISVLWKGPVCTSPAEPIAAGDAVEGDYK